MKSFLLAALFFLALAGAALAEAPRPACGRISTESGVLVSASDRTSQGTIYFVTGYACDTIPFYTGVGNEWLNVRTAQVSVSVSGSSGNVKWVLAYRCAGPAVCLGLSPAWTGDTNPGTGAGTAEATTQNGVLVNAVDVSGVCLAKLCTIVGVTRLSGSNVTEDSIVKRFVGNVFNLERREVSKGADSSNHTYNSATWRSYNADNAIRFEFVTARTTVVEYSPFAVITPPVAGTSTRVAGGVDSTSSPGCQWLESSITGRTVLQPWCISTAVVAGYHFVQLLESVDSGTGSFDFGSIAGMTWQ